MSPLARADSRGRLTRRLAIALVALSTGCAAVGPEPQFVIWLTPSTAQTLTVDDTLTMVATIQGRSPCECRWNSSDATVASISSEGLVRAAVPGFTTITATLVRDSAQKRSILITVAGR